MSNFITILAYVESDIVGEVRMAVPRHMDSGGSTSTVSSHSSRVGFRSIAVSVSEVFR